MASYDYTQAINTLTTAAIDEATSDLANLVTEGGEKLLKKMQSKGRLFMVNDAEKVKHPVLYGSGSTLYFDPVGSLGGATTGGDGSTTDALGWTASEIMSYALFDMASATRNINYPQAMPAGNHIPYISNVIKMHMMDILNKEEKLILRGEDTGSGSYASVGACSADSGAVAGRPFSLSRLIDSDASVVFGALGWDTGATLAHWKPQLVDVGATDPTITQWTTALDSAVLNASFSETERPDWVLTTEGAYKDIVGGLRSLSIINDKAVADLGFSAEIPYGGVSIDWSRYLDANAMWGISDGAADNPVIGINTNSLRLNLVAGGGVSDEKLGFVQKIGSTQTLPTRTNLFDRVQYKRCWSIDGGRRSFFQIEGSTVA